MIRNRPVVQEIRAAGRPSSDVEAGQWASRSAERMRVTNVPEANAFLDEEYREGWSL